MKIYHRIEISDINIKIAYALITRNNQAVWMIKS